MELQILAGVTPKKWMKDFLAEYYPDHKDDEQFYNSLKNAMNGRSYEAAYIRPGFLPKVKLYFQSKLNQK